MGLISQFCEILIDKIANERKEIAKAKIFNFMINQCTLLKNTCKYFYSVLKLIVASSLWNNCLPADVTPETLDYF